MSLTALHPSRHHLRPTNNRERKILTNALAWGLASFLTFWRASPESVSTAAVGASLLIVIDTFAGVLTAAFFQEFRSRKLRERLVAKLLYYTLFVLCSYVLAALLRAYWMMLAAWYAVLLIELASVGETLTRLHVRGGKRFGPAERVLKLIAQAMGEAAQATEPKEEQKDKDDAAS